MNVAIFLFFGVNHRIRGDLDCEFGGEMEAKFASRIKKCESRRGYSVENGEFQFPQFAFLKSRLADQARSQIHHSVHAAQTIVKGFPCNRKIIEALGNNIGHDRPILNS
jgi:hypothetical protein